MLTDDELEATKICTFLPKENVNFTLNQLIWQTDFLPNTFLNIVLINYPQQ